MTMDHWGPRDLGTAPGTLTLRGVPDVPEVLALHILPHWEVEGAQPLTSCCARHLHTHISVTTGPHTIQDGTQQCIPAWKEGGMFGSQL